MYHQSRGIYVKALEERPLVEPGNEWIWTAYNHLATTRISSGFGQGGISFLSVLEYCRAMGLSLPEREFLWDVVKELDGLFQKRMGEKAKAAQPPPRR